MDIIKYTSKIVKYLIYQLKEKRKKKELINNWILTTINRAAPSLSSAMNTSKLSPEGDTMVYGIWSNH